MSNVILTKNQYGKAENQVLQVEAVLPPGRTVTTLRVPSHAAGPDHPAWPGFARRPGGACR